MTKINLFKTSYGEIIAIAEEHGFKSSETDPGRILDSACEWLQSRGLAEYPESDRQKIPRDVRKMLGINEKGQGLVEYTLIVVLVALVFWVAIKNTELGNHLASAWSRVTVCVTTPLKCEAL